MALGAALHEAMPVVDGRPGVTTLAAYPVPRFCELPEIEVLIVDRPDLLSGGAGETPMIAVAPAVANAVFSASGTHRRHLPSTRPRHRAASVRQFTLKSPVTSAGTSRDFRPCADQIVGRSFQKKEVPAVTFDAVISVVQPALRRDQLSYQPC